jgi:hypothetical protein
VYSIIKRNWVANRKAVLVGFATVLCLSALIGLQAVVPFDFAFLGLIVGGIAVGLSWTEPRKAITAAFLAGLVAYFFGTVASVGSASVAAGYPAWRVAVEVAIGAFAGLIFGVVAGLWTIGGGLVGTVVRRRWLGRHVS